MSWNRSGRGRHTFLPSGGGNFSGGRGGASYGGYGRDYQQGYQRSSAYKSMGYNQQRGANRQSSGGYSKPGSNYGGYRAATGSYSHANKKRMRPSGGRTHSFKRQKFQSRNSQPSEAADAIELRPRSIVFASGMPGEDKEHCFITARFKDHPGLRCEPVVKIGKSKFFVRLEIKDLKKGSKAVASYDIKKPDLADIKAYLGEEFPVIKKKAKETIDLTAVEDEVEQGDDVVDEDIPDDKLDPENMPVKSLRSALSKRGLYTRGLKAELIRRLKEYLEAKKKDAAENAADGEEAAKEAGDEETPAEETSKEDAAEEASEKPKEGEEVTEEATPAEEKDAVEPMEEDGKEVNGTTEKPAEEGKAEEEEVVEPEVTQTYTVVMVLKRAPRVKKRFDDLLPRQEITNTRVVIMEFEATTGGKVTPERKRDPKVVVDQAVKGPMSFQYEDTVWPEIQEGDGSFKDVVTALCIDREAFLENETETNNQDRLFMDNQNLKKRVHYLSSELEASKTKVKDLETLINSTMHYLKTRGKTPLPTKEPQAAKEPAAEKEAETETAVANDVANDAEGSKDADEDAK